MKMMIIKEVLRCDQGKMNYGVAHPENYEGLPLLVYLHGAGERGEKLDHVYLHAIPKLLKEGREFPAVVLYPQCPGPFIWNNMVKELKELIDLVAAEYGIEKDRIMLTGSSMGGYGTWETAMCYPEYFAAIAPVAGGGVAWRALKLRKMPIKTYHGSVDTVVTPLQSEIMVEAVHNSGGKAELVYLEGLGHNDGIDEAYRNTDLIEWLLSHRRTDFSHIPELCEEMF